MRSSDGSTKCASTRARWETAHRLVGAAGPRFPNQFITNWSSGMAVSASGGSGGQMSLHALRTGHQVKIGAAVFLIVQRLPEGRWQLQNTATGEWRTFDENDLLDQFATNGLSFVVAVRSEERRGGQECRSRW